MFFLKLHCPPILPLSIKCLWEAYTQLCQHIECVVYGMLRIVCVLYCVFKSLSLLYLHCVFCVLCTSCIAYTLQFTVTTLSVLCVLSISSFSSNADEWQVLLFTWYESRMRFTFISFTIQHMYTMCTPLGSAHLCYTQRCEIDNPKGWTNCYCH